MKTTTLLLSSLFLAAAAIIPATANAQETAQSAPAPAPAVPAAINPDDLNKLSDSPDKTASKENTSASPGEKITDDYNAWWDSLPEKSKAGKTPYFVIIPIEVPSSNASWVKYRALAFEKATLQAQAKFVRDYFGTQLATSAREYFHDESSDTHQFPEDFGKNPSTTWGAIKTKTMALSEAKLDKALEKFGVNPEEYSKKPLPQKRQIFLDSFAKKSVVLAAGEVSGLNTTQTFIGTDGKGNYAVGVALIYSKEQRQLASDINNRRIPLITHKPGRSIAERISKDNAELSTKFGTRLLIDEQGSPCVVSYAQWASSYTGKDPVRQERARESAERVALTLADSYITEFQNARLTYLDKTKISGTAEQVVHKDSDGNISEPDPGPALTQIINEEIKRSGKADMLGRKTIKQWHYTTPEGHKIYGVVRAWTVEQLQKGQEVRNWKANTARPDSTPAKKTTSAPAGVTRGVSPDENDF